MNKLSAILLLWTLVLGACSQAASPAASSTNGNSSPAATAARDATLSEVQNEVTVQSAANQPAVPASNGMQLAAGAIVQTGANGRVRIDLLPEGTVVRVAPNSSFALAQIDSQSGAPFTKLSMLFGKIFVILKGGSLQVETPSGVASVRGSLLSVAFDPTPGRVQADCLEGHCSLANQNGDAVDLTDGQYSYIEGDEMPPSDAAEMDRQDVQDWLDENPDLSTFIDQLPDPQSFPEESTPPATEPPATEPPATEPPATEPPATEPPQVPYLFELLS